MAIRWRPPVAAAIAVAPSVVVEIFFEYRFAAYRLLPAFLTICSTFVNQTTVPSKFVEVIVGVMRTRRLDLLWHKILICESVGQVGIARIGKGKWNGNTEDKGCRLQNFGRTYVPFHIAWLPEFSSKNTTLTCEQKLDRVEWLRKAAERQSQGVCAVTGTFFLQNKVKNPTAKRILITPQCTSICADISPVLLMRLKKAHAATGAPSCVCVRKIWLSAAHRKPKRLDGSELPSLVAHLCCTCHSASLGRAPRARAGNKAIIRWDVGNKQYSGGGKRENGCDRSQTERPLKKPRVRRRRKGEERERRVYVQGKRERQREKGCRRRSLSSSRIRILRVSIFGGRVAVSNATRCSDSSPIDSTNKEISPTPHQVFPMFLNAINASAVLAVANSAGSSPVSNCLENLSVMGESSGCVAVGKPSTETCSQLGQEGDAADQHDTPMSKDVPDIEKEIDADMTEDKLCKSNQGGTSSNSSSFAFPASTTPSVAAAELTISCKLDSDNGTSSAAKATEHQPKAGDFDYRREKCLITAESNSAAILTSGFQDYSCTASILDNIDDCQLSCQREEATSSADKDIDRAINFKNRKGPLSTSTDFFKVVGTEAGEDVSRKSEIGLGCLDDALEVARQVALAVEREVVDYREHFCSSPEVNSGEMTGFHSPGSEEEQVQAVTEEVGGDSSSAGKDHSGTSSPDKESEITQHMSSDPGNSDKDKESPVPAQESVDKSLMDGCTFDLNADTCGDEPEMRPIMKISVAVSSPIAVFASSKGAPGLPVTPLHFEGEMGWKGSAATSAFRPASPRRTPDGKRTCSGQKQKSEFLGIDLNVAEREDDVDDEFTCVRELPISSGLPSRDSCAEVRSRPEKLNLDLNCLGDEDASTCPFSSQKLHLLNGEHSLSSASSSSHRHLSLGDFDLNDSPSFPDIGVAHNLDKASTKALESYGGPAAYDPVIKLMGSVIAVERNHNPNQAQQHSFLPNGLNIRPPIVSPALFVNPSCGYAGLATRPTISAPAAYYSPGSISYMVDPRGAAAIPHVAGAGGLGVPSARPPFLLGAANMPSDMAGFGMPPLHVNLNSGMPSTEGGSFEQFFLQGYRSRMEDQTKTSAQPSSSAAVGLKRKEPEPSLYGYKQMAPR
ncbi:hypothetical protein MUK42_11086 [Musa troglodytarum]|uniref:Uncharacterized protein n=1 Tax=Musa troglodytarum TaxID=320322 RepID=A0A9E7H1Q9_9LILI|nr:hypothetical protein MUK42_11086 [Musa troglodytarum]